VDNNRQALRTNATFVLSVGTHHVSVNGNGAQCGDTPVNIKSGLTTTITCANGKWTQQ
jgi:hypothetical protein